MTEKNSMTLCIRGRYTSSSSNYLIHPMGMEEERQFYGQQTTSGVMTVSAKSREREREREREEFKKQIDRNRWGSLPDEGRRLGCKALLCAGVTSEPLRGLKTSAGIFRDYPCTAAGNDQIP